MENLYEKIDSLKEFTSLKESIIKKEDPFVTSIKLCYSEDYYVELFSPAIKGFNKYDNVGYFIADLGSYTSEEDSFEYLISNEINRIIISLDDFTEKEYYIEWSSIFDNIYDNLYVMLFEVRNGEYYQ